VKVLNRYVKVLERRTNSLLFNSLEFLIFFPIVLIVYYIIPDRIKYLWLLAASYYFYMCWNAKYAILILFSTAVTYLSGILLERAKQSEKVEAQKIRTKKWIVAASFILNLSILFWFKYLNFTTTYLSILFSKLNIQLHIPQFDIILPVGISFYTFQALSYTMDVYRDEIYAEKNFFRYALFVSFFPQLVAGPIERSKNLLKQLAVPKKFSFERAKEGFLLMLWGYFLKLVLADRIAIFVDTVYGDIEAYGGWYLIIGTVLFAFQIYCDFSGYSTIAMGAAKILGINLMENFNAPYLSTSVGTFWRNWHISLTSWFKDYLYIPLGGSRKGKLRKYINKMIVFLVSGLWHGARLSYVVWGGLNGLYQVIGEILQPVRDRFVSRVGLNRENCIHKLLQGLFTFVLIDISWVFFRATGTREGLRIVKSMITAHNPEIFLDGSLYTCGLDSRNFVLMILCIGILMIADILKRRRLVVRQEILKKNYLFRCIFISVAITAILLFGIWGPTYDAANFIYFQF